MNNLLASLPAGFRYVLQMIIAILCCGLFMCLFAWIMFWCQKYITFLPWPH